MFDIEVKKTIRSGILWWKKDITVWVSADLFGNPVSYYSIASPICERFRTLEEAKERIYKWLETATYIYL